MLPKLYSPSPTIQEASSTLKFGIDVAPGINVAFGTFGKNNKSGRLKNIPTYIPSNNRYFDFFMHYPL